jgi:DNA-binding response OmpR family regulator
LEPIANRILVVDDDVGIREAVARMLRHSDYHVSCAADGEDGWDVLCTDKFDVLITDQDMPRLTGVGLIRRLRASPLSLPVILATGNIPWYERDLLDLLHPGMALEKPFSLADLLANIRRVLTPLGCTGPLTRAGPA